MLVVHDPTSAVQVCAAGGEQLDVVGGGQLGLVQVGGGLFQGQRQVTEQLSKGVGVVVGEPGRPAAQQGDGFGVGKHVEVEHRAEVAETATAGGDQDVAVPAGQDRPDVVDVLGVVEDQQPALSASQLGTDCPHCGVRVRVGWQAEWSGERGDLAGDQTGLLGVDPPHQVIGGGMPVGVLDHGLGLAYSPQPVHRLNRHGRPRTEVGADGAEFGGPAGEVRIPTRDSEHLRQRTGKPGLGRHHPQRKRRRRARPGPPAHRGGDGIPQPPPRRGLGQAHQVDAHHSGEQTRRPVITPYPHRDQLALVSLRVLGPRRLPLGRAIHRRHIVRGQHRHRPRRARHTLIHPADPVTARHHVPCLDHHPVPVLLQQPGNPLCPRPIGLRVGHEKVPPRPISSAVGHPARFPYDG